MRKFLFFIIIFLFIYQIKSKDDTLDDQIFSDSEDDGFPDYDTLELGPLKVFMKVLGDCHDYGCDTACRVLYDVSKKDKCLSELLYGCEDDDGQEKECSDSSSEENDEQNENNVDQLARKSLRNRIY